MGLTPNATDRLKVTRRTDGLTGVPSTPVRVAAGDGKISIFSDKNGTN